MTAIRSGLRQKRVSRKLSVSVAALAAIGLTGCGASSDVKAPQPTPPASSVASAAPQDPAPSTSPTPSPRRSPTEEASPHPKQTSGSSAVFQHFKVAVSQLERRSESQMVLRAQVCVRSLPPDPQGNRTRISWDPWSVRAGKSTMKPRLVGARPKGLFPPNGTYAVGDCASGWISFPTTSDIGEINYENALGDKAVWDADRLAQPPTKSQRGGAKGQNSRPGGIGEGTFIVNDDIRPGRYKARASGSGSCYWARLKDDTGEPDSIIANNITDGSAVVTVKSSDGAFETNGCTPWLRQ